MSRAHRKLDEGRLTSAALEFLESLAPLDEIATHQDMARSLEELLADLTSPHPPPSEHDAWRREADLARPDSLPPQSGTARRRRSR